VGERVIATGETSLVAQARKSLSQQARPLARTERLSRILVEVQLRTSTKSERSGRHGTEGRTAFFILLPLIQLRSSHGRKHSKQACLTKTLLGRVHAAGRRYTRSTSIRGFEAQTLFVVRKHMKNIM